MTRGGMLALIDVAAERGLEIGALAAPIITRDMGPVEYVDRTSTEDLRKWYAPNTEVDTSKIVEVDHVWGEQTLAECVGGRKYDYVVASHVIEHVPDLLGWLVEIAAVLADGGIASFAVPDKRATFDILRRTSSDAEMVDAYVLGLRRPGARQIFDHFMGFRDLGAEPIVSGRLTPVEMPSQHDAKDLMEFCRRTAANGDYIDTHCWVFTPDSFLDAMDLANRLQILPFEIGAFFPTEDGSHEFFVSLRRLPDSWTPQQRREAFLASRPANAPIDEVEDLAKRVAGLRQEVEALRTSTSWRMTAPLRTAITWIRAR